MNDQSTSSTKRRPSAEEWEKFKSTIVDLYANNSLHDVRRVMKEKYGFRATKRMYDTRFRRWGISKIIKSSEKEAILRQLMQHNQLGNLQSNAAFMNVDPAHLKKVMRYLASQTRKGDRKKSSATVTGPLEDYGGVQRSAGVSGSPEETSEDDSPLSGNSPNTDGPQPSPYSSQSANSSPSSSILDLFATSPTVVASTPQANTPPNGQLAPGALVPVMHASATSRNLQLILHNVSVYYISRLENLGIFNPPGAAPNQADILSIGASPASQQFWSNIKNGIYLWKVGSKEDGYKDKYSRGFRALSDANALALEALRSQPFDFLREVLSTLSPANTSIYPRLRLRTHILGYLIEQAANIFPPEHPLLVLFTALRDDDDNPLVSRTALCHLLELFSTNLGRSHAVSYKVMETLVMQMRRGGDPLELMAARGFAENALTLAQIDHGEGSHQARSAAVELSHVLTGLGEYDRTLPLRLGVVRETDCSPVADGEELERHFRQDSLAAHTMEDIAEYYVRFGKLAKGAEWLRRAKRIGSRVWGEQNVATLYVADKLNDLERGVLDGQVADGRMMVAAS